MQAIPIALAAGGSILKGVAAYKAGKYNRAVDQADAVTSLNEGVAQSQKIRDAGRIALGRQVGAQAESGFQIGTGSAIDNLLESATNNELDIMDTMRQARSRYAAYQQAGAQAYAEGKNSLISGLFGAASSVAGGAQDYASAGGGKVGGGSSSAGGS